jgi:hypothetical protein
MTKTVKFSTGAIFGKMAKELGFQGSGVTRYKEYADCYLIVNHQKSAYNRHFYVNVVISYKELLGKQLCEEDFKNLYKSCDWHVDFRIGRCPGMVEKYAELSNLYVDNEDSEALALLIKQALSRLLDFMDRGHDRKTIRQMKESKQFTQVCLWKEV